MLCDKIRTLAYLALESQDPGYILALLLLVIRADEQDRIYASSSPKALRNFARNLRTYRKLGASLCDSLSKRQLMHLCQEAPDVCDIMFLPEKLCMISRRMSTVAQFLESVTTDNQGRVRLEVIQDRINHLQAAIGRSQ